MGYISEDYCSEELSGMLMERGYIGATNTYLGKDGINVKQITLQSAMKWLREVHNIFITIEIKGCSRKEDFIYFKWSIAKYNTDMIDRIDNNLTSPQDYWIAPLEEKETYERTCEAAIKYCLEKLV